MAPGVPCSASFRVIRASDQRSGSYAASAGSVLMMASSLDLRGTTRKQMICESGAVPRKMDHGDTPRFLALDQPFLWVKTTGTA